MRSQGWEARDRDELKVPDFILPAIQGSQMGSDAEVDWRVMPVTSFWEMTCLRVLIEVRKATMPEWEINGKSKEEVDMLNGSRTNEMTGIVVWNASLKQEFLL
jgi:hypothetical protein